MHNSSNGLGFITVYTAVLEIVETVRQKHLDKTIFDQSGEFCLEKKASLTNLPFLAYE